MQLYMVTRRRRPPVLPKRYPLGIIHPRRSDSQVGPPAAHMASTTQAKHEALRLPQGVGADPALVSAAAAASCARLDASDHGEIYRAALEHRPLFRLSLRLHTAADEPVYFQQDSARFGQAHTLRLLQQHE